MVARIPMRGGDEHDALSRRAKWRFNWEAGDRKRCKRSYGRRFRQWNRRDVQRVMSAEGAVVRDL